MYFSYVMVRILFSLTRTFSLVHTRAERARKILELRYVTVQIFDPPYMYAVTAYAPKGRVTNKFVLAFASEVCGNTKKNELLTLLRTK